MELELLGFRGFNNESGEAAGPCFAAYRRLCDRLVVVGEYYGRDVRSAGRVEAAIKKSVFGDFRGYIFGEFVKGCFV